MLEEHFNLIPMIFWSGVSEHY